MWKVQTILRFTLVAIGFSAVACGSPSLPRDVPLEFPDPEPTPEKREPQVPEGFMGDPGTARFHRVACPRCKEIDPRHQVFFEHPYAAINEGYSPCDDCEPMVGWQ